MGTLKNFCQQFLTEITMDYVILIITDIMFDEVKNKKLIKKILTILLVILHVMNY
jgi:hypothetical protein